MLGTLRTRNVSPERFPLKNLRFLQVKSRRKRPKNTPIRTEHTEIITKDGHKRNGCLRYTILPIKNALDLCYKRQLEKAEQALERQRTQANAERLGIQFVPADDERSA